MRNFILFLFVFSFDSLAVSESQKLQEIKILGDYYAGDPGEIERSEKYYRKRGTLEEGQTLADKPHLAHKLEYLGKERFRNSRVVYCHEKILDIDRESAIVFNPNLRARMYDREGNLLAEDILRDERPGRDPFLKLTVAYLPYLNNGDVTIRIVRLEGEEEVLLFELTDIYPQENIERRRTATLYNYEYLYKPYEKTLITIPCYQ